ncbi:uncharacterized protein LOC132194171 isoform X2 [Neocloeon triangulifer]|uniref:uncharacterized protein LOC132194171 isoform X2 n=1 Tax=Neocloeon triangulifer TaxID=2078957 RepID=UPI00286ED2A6|nr:uncharacterized protein LOC132194171 isoform X2 [Neocloeon triangulifer]
MDISKLVFIIICLPPAFAIDDERVLSKNHQNSGCQYGLFGKYCTKNIPENRYCVGASGPHGDYNFLTGLCLNGCAFAGQQPPYCDRDCDDGKYGFNCTLNQPTRTCFGSGRYGSYNKETGNCINGCAKSGLQSPGCSQACEYGKFGMNCGYSFTKRVCAGADGNYGNYDVSNGKCLQGCVEPGKEPPFCTEDCQNGKYGWDCYFTASQGVCAGLTPYGEYDKASGVCYNCMEMGKKPPNCKDDCDEGKFGQNCQYDLPKSEKRCSGHGTYGDYNRKTGHCRISCLKPGFYFPPCIKECTRGHFGYNCKDKLPTTKKCSGATQFGDYDPATGNCKSDCDQPGVKFPECEKPCDDGWFGRKCHSTLRSGTCAGPKWGNYDKKTGHCKNCASPGYKMPSCTEPCDDGFYGHICNQKFARERCAYRQNYQKHLAGYGDYDRATGNCTSGCSEHGLKFPECVKECENGKYGLNCASQLAPGMCAGQEIGNYNKTNGHCKSCAKMGFKLPFCNQRCDSGLYGLNCDYSVGDKCLNGKYDTITGNCTVSCTHSGFQFPSCEKECEGGKYGINCREQLREKKCSGAGNYGDYNKANGECVQSCARPGLQFPHCKKECDGGKFGLNCNEIIKSGACAGKTEFGEYDKVNGSCSLGCKEIGIQPPKCITECDKGSFGMNCNEKFDPSVCVDESYNRTTGLCLNGCSREDLIPPSCIEEVTNYLLVGAIVAVFILLFLILASIMVFWKRRATCWLINMNRLMESKEVLVNIPLGPLLPDASSIPSDQGENSNETTIINVASFDEYLEMAIKFDLFKKQHVKFPRGQTKSWDVGKLSENKSKNRYGNLAAYDETRVKLNFQTGLGQSDYINANFIDGYKMKKTYIATQGPKSNTLVDFWRMIWQEQVSLIVMVTNLIENGKTKCEKYWPEERQSVCVKGLQVQSVKEEIYPDYTKRTMRLMNGDQNRLVVQMHYTQWPDHGVPFYAKSLACFMEKILEIKSDSPVVVHCSAGVGRTGTIILIDACLRMAKAEGFFNAFDTLGKIRAQRANLVDNEMQYRFAHLVLYEVLCVPNYDVPCGRFTDEIKHLLANGKNLLNQHWLGINRICTMDWQRLQAQSVVSPERFGLHDYPAASDKYLKLFPSQPTERNLRLINAVFVDGFKKKNKFICIHTPTQSTIVDFWQMIDQYKVEHVIVLNEFQPNENDFLPLVEGRRLCAGDIQVILKKTFQLKRCTILDIENSKGNCLKAVCFAGWPTQNSMVADVESLVELWEQTEIASLEKSSVLVCNDGVTACGFFAALGFVLEKIKLEQRVDVVMAVRCIRNVRPGFITGIVQFEMLYKGALSYLEKFETYGNFK